MTASHNLKQFCPFRTKQRISLFSEQVGEVYFVTKRTLITANQIICVSHQQGPFTSKVNLFSCKILQVSGLKRYIW